MQLKVEMNKYDLKYEETPEITMTVKSNVCSFGRSTYEFLFQEGIQN